MTEFSSQTQKDDNFCFPIPDVLENDRVKVVPFIPAHHAQPLFSIIDIPLWQYIPFGPYTSASDMVNGLWEGRMHARSSETLFVIYDKTQTPEETAIVGAIGFVNASPTDLLAEIGPIIVSSQFQGKGIAVNAVGLLMHYALDLPERGGLGLRRLQWHANVVNEGSVKLAEKMGFVKEGVMRWHRVLERGKGKEVGSNGRKVRKGDPREGWEGRDSVLLAVCWDEWEDGGREKVDKIMGLDRR
ncbi:hypothetical protein VNI00_019152 [Paramarasmius palmivorus]|uniref:N-acetyltransferase domain-containing protein n=1 Tax=Paramarasmius palmivorus TaxID=297713 RepID=A0AAW0AQ14_9AGAR